MLFHQISELKRINNIHKDNEIFAHRSIKVPMQPYSILTETLNPNIELSKNQTDVFDDTLENHPSTSREDQITNLITTPVFPYSSNVDAINNIILNSVCEPAHDTFNAEDELETDHLITLTERRNGIGFADPFKCSGSDWGLSWFHLLGFSLILGFAGPIIYIIYITDSTKHTNKTI